jgi:hypothetical protein
MSRTGFGLLMVSWVVFAALACPSIGGVVEGLDKYGTCENPTDVDNKTCEGQSGNCYNVELNVCSSYASNCPGGDPEWKSHSIQTVWYVYRDRWFI